LIASSGSGSATINFKNCGSGGLVNLYVNGNSVGTAAPGPAVAITFTYNNNDILMLKDEGFNSIVSVVSFSYGSGSSWVNYEN
jgi:hypothetical protein